MAYDEDTSFDILSIVEAQFGADAACDFARAFAGRELRIPVKVDPRSVDTAAMIEVLGSENTAWLCEQLANVEFYVPGRKARYLLVDKLTRQKVPVSRICKLAGLSERQIYNIRAVRRRLRQEAAARAASQPFVPEPQS